MIDSERISSPSTIRILQAASPADWAAAERLVHELVEWMRAELALDAPNHQKDASSELVDMQRFYALPDGLFLLGRVDGRPAGTTGIRMLDEDTAELKRVWVTPVARGRGLAPRMLEQSISAARALGARRVRLETEPTLMATAVQMYQAAGFEPIPHYSTLSEHVPTLLSMEKRVA
jgi:GNAT superfamily N-acetyltransferase